MTEQQPEIRELTPKPAVVELASAGRDGVRDAIDNGFATLFGRLSQLDVEPADPPYIRYLETAEPLELELGVPVASDAAARDGLRPGGLPGGRAAVLRHVGAYEELRAACERLRAWVREHGEEPAGPFWESYVTNPAEEPDPAKRVTDIYQPLR
jgi:AraC family transcriptional regulator